jgi:tetratricopeptide (TPR) repeat protein
LSISYHKIAGIHLKKGDLKEALEGYQQALTISEKLLKQDPQNQTLKDDVGYYQQQIADIKQQMEESAQEKE